MRAISSPTPNGLLTKSSAPRSSASIFSASRSRADSTMIGTCDHCRTWRITSLPSPSGRPRSSTTTSGGSLAMRFIASASVAGARHLVVVGFQRRLEKAQDGRLVVDHEDAGVAAHGGASSRGKRQRHARAASAERPGSAPRCVPPCASMMPLAMASPRPVLSPPSATPAFGARARARISRTRAAAARARMPAAVVGDAQENGCGRCLGVDDDLRLGRRMRNGVADHIAERLLDQLGIGTHHRQVGGQANLDASALHRGGARRRRRARRSRAGRPSRGAPPARRHRYASWPADCAPSDRGLPSRRGCRRACSCDPDRRACRRSR